MKVENLITQLEKIPGDTEVWVSRDEEGNGFNPLTEVNFTKVWRHGKWEFDFLEEDESDYPQDQLQDLVVLWP